MANCLKYGSSMLNQGIFVQALLAAFWLMTIVSPALAHRINVFAWLENDRVIVECDYGRDRPAIKANITVYDSATKQPLLSGESGQNGQFTFRVPDVIREGHGLIIEVNSGQGHRNEWSMDASELYAAASLAAGFEQARLENAEQDYAAASRPVQISQPLPDGNSDEMQRLANPEDLKRVIRQAITEALDDRLPPVRKMPPERNRGPGIVEVIGGLGWIMGIAGAVLWFRSRRKGL